MKKHVLDGKERWMHNGELVVPPFKKVVGEIVISSASEYGPPSLWSEVNVYKTDIDDGHVMREQLWRSDVPDKSCDDFEKWLAITKTAFKKYHAEMMEPEFIKWWEQQQNLIEEEQ